MALSHSLASLHEWVRARTETPPEDAATLRVRLPGGSSPTWSCDADDARTAAGALAAADWITDHAAPPCVVRLDWLDGSGGYLSGSQRSFALAGEERRAPEVEAPGARPVADAPRLGSVVDVDGIRLPLTRPDGPDPDRSLREAADAAGLSGEARAILLLAVAGRAEVASLREENRALLVANLQQMQVLREMTGRAFDVTSSLATTLRQARTATDALLPDMMAHTLATERRAGDDRAAAAVAEARAGGTPAPEAAGETPAAGEVGAALGELRGLLAEGSAMMDKRRLGADGPTLAVLRAAAEGRPEEMAKWAAGLSPEGRAAWVGRLGPVLAALAS